LVTTPPKTETPDFKIGPYTVLRHIAQGGTGAVYEVLDPANQKRYALKIGTSTDPESTRFERIHRVLGRLNHEGVVSSEGAGVTADGRTYHLLGYIAGQPAQVFAKSMGKPGSQARTIAVITIAIHIAEALGYLHAHSIIHRDIKSANIMVRADHSACLIDFGTALMPGIVAIPGRFVGTYTYAPPEQLEASVVDARSDLYAFGVLLYRMLSGLRPLVADTPQALTKLHLTKRPAPLNTVVPNIPTAIVSLVAQMLEKRPQDRPQSAQSVVDVLRASATGF
jgi:serine/threonine-protein kinase